MIFNTYLQQTPKQNEWLVKLLFPEVAALGKVTWEVREEPQDKIKNIRPLPKTLRCSS